MWRILNDRHLGVKRSAGTTPQSVEALKKTLMDSFHHDMLEVEADNDTIILGDLFDKFLVDNSTVVEVIKILSNWMRVNSNKKLLLVRGNHDMSNRSDTLSSLDLVGEVLLSGYGNFQYITQPTVVDDYVVMPHVANQDEFDYRLSQLQHSDRILLAHCNYDNFFATQSDHSLNLSTKQACGFKRCYIAHEHPYRLKDNVMAFGNQFPTSVSDCVDGQDKSLFLVDDIHAKPFCTWKTEGNFIDCDWKDIPDISGDYQFIRVSGTAKPEEAGLAVSEIAKLRRKSSAFVVSNAVQIEGVELTEADMAEITTLEGLDIKELLLSRLSKKHRKRVEGLLNVT